MKEGLRFLCRYAELEGEQTWHMKASLVTQAEKSNYQLTEAQLGGKFTRHDLSIQQVDLLLHRSTLPLKSLSMGPLFL